MIAVRHLPREDFEKCIFMFNGNELAEYIRNNVKESIEVAHVDTDDMQVAYELTNTIDHAWWLNKEVKPFVNKARSTSMGDLMIGPDGTYAVAACGFVKVW